LCAAAPAEAINYVLSLVRSGRLAPADVWVSTCGTQQDTAFCWQLGSSSSSTLASSMCIYQMVLASDLTTHLRLLHIPYTSVICSLASLRCAKQSSLTHAGPATT
jgi:hypothetical protein